MNCNEFDVILAGMLDGPRDPAWDMAAAHAAHCPRCGAQFESIRVLERAIDAWKRSGVQEDAPERTERIVQSLHAALTEPSGSSGVPKRSRTAAARAVAAETRQPTESLPTARRRHDRAAFRMAMLSSCLALVSLMLLLSSDEKPPQPEASHGDVVRRDALEPQTDSVALPQLVHEAEDAWRVLAADALASVRNVPLPLRSPPLTVPESIEPRLPIVPLWPAPDADPANSGTPHDPPDTGLTPGLSAGIEPIQRDVTKAVGFLWRAVPATPL